MKVTANVATPLANGSTVSVRRSDSKSGLGDIILMPLMLNYNVNPDFNINFRTAIYAPTGSYKVGRLANTGKNFWTLEPTLAFMYFGQKPAAKPRCSSVPISIGRTRTPTINPARSSMWRVRWRSIFRWPAAWPGSV
jgi:hypothetical protein